VGCTSTIMYQIYHEKKLEIKPDVAGLLCAAIISDTLMFRSPTCTNDDVVAARELAKLAKIDIEEFGSKMFKAGSNLSNKSSEEIFYQDFKKFIVDDTTFGIGQINAMSAEELENIKRKLLPSIERECGKNGIQIIYFMLTNIRDESTELLITGDGAEQLIKTAFNVEKSGNTFILPEIVSRKKQLIPALMRVLQPS